MGAVTRMRKNSLALLDVFVTELALLFVDCVVYETSGELGSDDESRSKDGSSESSETLEKSAVVRPPISDETEISTDEDGS